MSIVSFGAELGLPPRCLMFNNSHSIIKHFPSRCFVIKSAGLTVPQIFSILSSWFFSFCSSQKYFVSMCLMAPLPLRKASPSRCICPDSHVSLVSKLSYRVGQPDGLTRHPKKKTPSSPSLSHHSPLPPSTQKNGKKRNKTREKREKKTRNAIAQCHIMSMHRMGRCL